MPPRARGDFLIGDRVSTSGRLGTVLFFGTVHFATGKYVGVEFDTPEGKHDGSMKGERYFTCKPNHGAFVKPSVVTLVAEAGTSQPIPAGAASSSSSSSAAPPATSSTETPAAASSSSSSSSTTITTEVSSSGSTSQSTSRISSRRPSESEPSSTSGGVVSEAPAKPSAATSSLIPPTPIVSFELPPLEEVKRAQQQQPIPAPAPVPIVAAATPSVPATAELTRLQAAYDALKASNAKLSQDHANLQSAFSSLQAEKSNVDSSILKLNSELSSRDRQLAELRTELSESASGNNQVESLQNMIEMLTLDKALAEESQECAQQELEIMTNKYENMELELNLLREQHAALQLQQSSQHAATVSSSSSDVIVDNESNTKLLEQNALLSDALRKLRDLNLSEKQSFTTRITELEKQLASLSDVESTNIELRSQLATSHANEADLKEQLDAALEFEKMIETLSHSKLDLEEQLAASQRSVTYLQSLVTASEEVEEGYKELQQQLQNELESKEYALVDLTQRYKLKNEQIEDCQMTLRKFRELTRTLESENAEMKNKLEHLLASGANFGVDGANIGAIGGSNELPVSGTSLLATRTSTLLASRLKQVRVAYLDSLMSHVEKELMKKKMEFVQLYIPTNITLDDRSLGFLQLLDRIKSKSEVLVKVWSQFYGGDLAAAARDRDTNRRDGGGASSNKLTLDLGGSSNASSASTSIGASDQFVLAWKACLLLASIMHAIENMIQALWRIDVDLYNSVCMRSQAELTPIEHILDSYLNMIQNDTLNELTSLQSLIQANWILYSFILQKFPLHSLLTAPTTSATSDAASDAVVVINDLHVLPYRMSQWVIPHESEERTKWKELEEQWHRRVGEAKAIPAPVESVVPSPSASVLPSLSTFALTLSQATSLTQCLASSVGDVLDLVVQSLKRGRAKKRRERGESDKKEAEIGHANVALDDDAGGETDPDGDLLEPTQLWHELADSTLNNYTLALQLAHTTVKNYHTALDGGRGLEDETTRRQHDAGLTGLAPHLHVLDELIVQVMERMTRLGRDTRVYGTSESLNELAEKVPIEADENATPESLKQLIQLLRSCKTPATADDSRSLLALLTDLRTELFTTSKRIMELTELVASGLGSSEDGQLVSPSQSQSESHHVASLKALHQRTTSFVFTGTLVDANLNEAAASGQDKTPSSSSLTSASIQPWFHHPLTIRSQLSSTAQLRHQLQELTTKLTEKTRELFAARSAISEEHAKQEVLRQQLQSHLTKANAQVEFAQMVDNLKAQLDESAKQLTLAKTEVDKLTRENKAVRKQMLKLKAQYLKDEQTRAATAQSNSNAAAVAGSTGSVTPGLTSSVGAPSSGVASSSLASSTSTTHAISQLSNASSASLVELVAEVELLRRTLASQREELATWKVRQSMREMNDILPILPVESIPPVRKMAAQVSFGMNMNEATVAPSTTTSSTASAVASPLSSSLLSLPPPFSSTSTDSSSTVSELRFLRSKLTQVASTVWKQRITPKIVKLSPLASETPSFEDERKTKESAEEESNNSRKLHPIRITPYQQYLNQHSQRHHLQQCCDKLTERVHFIADQQRQKIWTA